MGLRQILVLAPALLLMTACSSGQSTVTYNNLPPGDAGRGEALFTQTVNGAPACSTCHTLDGSTLVGPTLQNYVTTAEDHAEDATVESYTLTSIVRPAAHIVAGFPNAMYAQYAQRLSDQELADLIAYLLTL